MPMPVDRRRFLNAAGAGVAALGLRGTAFSGARSSPPLLNHSEGQTTSPGLPPGWRSMRKLDAHGHVASRTRGLQWSRPAELVHACDRLGIERICCSIPIAGGEMVSADVVRECNDGVLEAMRQFPGRILGYCFVQPGNGADSLAEIDRCLDAGMIGVKLYNQFKHSDPAVFPVAEKCISRGIPVLGHASHVTDPERRGTQPNASTGENFCQLARRYPELILIMAHINGGGDWELGIRFLRDCPGVYLDTSGSGLDEGTVERAVRDLGPRRILFGTDSTMEGGVGKILSADLTPEQREDIFWRNFQGILDRARS